MNKAWDAWVVPQQAPARATVEGKLITSDYKVEIMIEGDLKDIDMDEASLQVLLLISPLSWHTSLAFILGAQASGSAGYIGMYTATQANVRTTTAAHDKGAPEALTVAFFGGSIMGPPAIAASVKR